MITQQRQAQLVLLIQLQRGKPDKHDSVCTDSAIISAQVSEGAIPSESVAKTARGINDKL